MKKELEASNVFRINSDNNFFYFNFARVREFRNDLTDNDVEDLKEIKLEAKHLSAFISVLMRKIKEFEDENDVKILNVQE